MKFRNGKGRIKGREKEDRMRRKELGNDYVPCKVPDSGTRYAHSDEAGRNSDAKQDIDAYPSLLSICQSFQYIGSSGQGFRRFEESKNEEQRIAHSLGYYQTV